MVEPPRLLEGDDESGGSGLTRLLISSAQSEAPHERALQRTLTSLGIGGVAVGTVTASAVLASAKTGAAATSAVTTTVASGVVTSGGVAANGALAGGVAVTSAGATSAGATGTGAVVGGVAFASKALVTASVVKWVGVTVVGSAMALGAAQQLGAFEARRDAPAETTSLVVGNAPLPPESNAPEAKTPVDLVAPSPPEANAPAVQAPAELVAPLPAEAEPAPAVSDQAAPPARTSRLLAIAKLDAPRQSKLTQVTTQNRTARQVGSDVRQEPSGLAKEVEALDRAREALSASQFKQALAEVQAYFGAFPRGYLLPEALFLKMEALERSGQRGEAKVTASRLVSVAPGAPQAARARQLIKP